MELCSVTADTRKYLVKLDEGEKVGEELQAMDAEIRKQAEREAEAAIIEPSEIEDYLDDNSREVALCLASCFLTVTQVMNQEDSRLAILYKEQVFRELRCVFDKIYRNFYDGSYQDLRRKLEEKLFNEEKI